MIQHFVKYLLPGSFFSNEEISPIQTWDVPTAQRQAPKGAFAFQFTTRSRGEADLDSKQTAQSGRYYLGGEVRTRDEVLAGTDPKEATLRDNVRYNKWNRIIKTPLGNTQLLDDGDTVL